MLMSIKPFKDKSIALWGVNFDKKGPGLEEMQVAEVSKLPVLFNLSMQKLMQYRILDISII